MRIGVCNLSVGQEFIESVSIGHKTLVDYCKRNDYEFFYETELLDETRHAYWNKILVIQKYLNKVDYLVWIDSDIIILNDRIKLEDIIKNFMKDKDFLLCRDNGLLINTGVWFCKNNEYVNNMLTQIFEQRQFETTRTPEQDSFHYLWSNNIDNLGDRSVVLPNTFQHVFNSAMFNLQKDSLLVHFLGIHRKDWMQLVMQEHCPFQDENEPVEVFYSRIGNLTKTLGIPIANRRIAVLSLCIGDKYKECMKYGRRSKIDYCNKYAYDFIEDETVYDKTRPIAWSKILLVKKYLSSYDYVWLVDADTIIMNPEIRLEQIISENIQHDRDVLVSRDISGEINTGSVFFKNTLYCSELIDLIYSQTQFINDEYWEQTAFNHIYNNDMKNTQYKITVLSQDKQHLFNCVIGLYRKDVFMIHAFGVRGDPQWTQRILNDVYQGQKDEETEDQYKFRMSWFKQRYLC